MAIFNWLDSTRQRDGGLKTRQRGRPRRPTRWRPNVEVLEEHLLMTTGADLVVATASSTASSVVVPGDRFTIDWTVSNQGDAPTNQGFYDSIYLSTNSTLGNDAVKLADKYVSNTLDAGGSYSTSYDVSISRNIAPGVYYLFVKTDSNNYQVETDETNNTRAVRIVVNDSGIAPGVTIDPISGLTTTKSGGTATFTVVLTTRPTADVTIPLTSSNPNEGTVSPASLVFTPTNWSVPETVMINGVNDHTAGDVDYQVQFGTVVSGDPTYSGIEPGFVTVTNRDDIPLKSAPQVSSVLVNDGSAQRSMVTSLTLAFSGVVTIDAGAFRLTHSDGTSVGLRVSTQELGGQTLATLVFEGDDIVGRSLADGKYTLTVSSDKVHDSDGQALDGNGTGTPGGDYVNHVSRLFGDSDGDGDVDNKDYFAFRKTAGKSLGDSDYLWYLDSNGDGTVDLVTDFAAFKAQNRKTLV